MKVAFNLVPRLLWALGNYALAGKLLCGGHLSKSLQWVPYAQMPKRPIAKGALIELQIYCPKPLFQGKGKCEAIDTKMILYCQEVKTHFHKKGFALSLDLKVKVFGSRN